MFVYGSPTEVYQYTNEQRFKTESKNGKWTRENYNFNGTGTRGEYNILGFNYSGGLVYNVYFAVDGLPETTPDNWQFLDINGAYESWQDKSKFKYTEQCDYMKNTHLWFDSIDYSTRTIDPYNLKEYNISANSIGLSKVMLNTASTWKTNGVVTVKRKDYKGRVFVATLTTKPMAASANINSNLNIQDKYTLDENQDEIKIKFDFGSDAINLNNYANKKHIKNITSVLYINGNEMSRIESEKTDHILRQHILNINRKEYTQNKDYVLNIKVKSYLYTEFNVDGLLQNEIEKNITIHIDKKLEVPMKVIDVKQLEKKDSEYVVKELIKTDKTNLKGSEGFIEKGRYICINIKKNINDFDISKVQIKIGENILPKEDIQLIKDTKDYVYLKIKVDKFFSNTLAGWGTLREKENSYFGVDFNKVGSRIREPNILKIKYEKTEINKKIDVIDSYLLNSNYDFSNGVINKNTLQNNIPLESWKI